MLLFAMSFVILARAEQHMKPGYWVSRYNDPDPRKMDRIGGTLLQRGQRIRRLALLVFAVFAICAITWR